MAKRGNYGAEKRQKEIKKNKKRAEKLERKHQKNQDDTLAEPEDREVDQTKASDDAVDPSSDPV
jgi:hypothetical protein